MALPTMTRARLRVLLEAIDEGTENAGEAVARVQLADRDADALLAHMTAHRPVRAAQIADRIRGREKLLARGDAAPACLLGYFLLTHRTAAGPDLSAWTSALAERFADVPDALVIHAAALTAQHDPLSGQVRALLLKAADPDLGLPRFTQGLRLLVSVLEDLRAFDDSRGMVHQRTADALGLARGWLVSVDPDQFLATYDGRSPLAPPGLPPEWSPSSGSVPAERPRARPIAEYLDEALRALPNGMKLSDSVRRAGPVTVAMDVLGTGPGAVEAVLTVWREQGSARRSVGDVAIAYGTSDGSTVIAVTDADGQAAFSLAPGGGRPSDKDRGSRAHGFSLAPTQQVRHIPLVRVPGRDVVLAADTAERSRLQHRVQVGGITFDLQEYDDRSTGAPTLRVEAHASSLKGWATFLARPAAALDAVHELYAVPLVPRGGGLGSGALDMGPATVGLDWYVSPFLTRSIDPDVAKRSLARASDSRTAQALDKAVRGGHSTW
ncbi:hypothetical protein ABZX85_17355 [Streptomyces sp. NPDC004539]|uniref:hypothetical protein n=1 Tax=Streptomyces sp. NPDC004539 TaxID=3154280 RepID=UPI0033A1BB52